MKKTILFTALSMPFFSVAMNEVIIDENTAIEILAQLNQTDYFTSTDTPLTNITNSPRKSKRKKQAPQEYNPSSVKKAKKYPACADLIEFEYDHVTCPVAGCVHTIPFVLNTKAKAEYTKTLNFKHALLEHLSTHAHNGEKIGSANGYTNKSLYEMPTTDDYIVGLCKNCSYTDEPPFSKNSSSYLSVAKHRRPCVRKTDLVVTLRSATEHIIKTTQAGTPHTKFSYYVITKK